MPDDIPNAILAIEEPTGKESETRVKDGRSARGLVQRLILADKPRSKRRTDAKGMVDGNPPYPAEKLRAAGLSWQANLNFMEGKALMDSSGIPYYSIFSGPEYYVETKTAFQPDHPDAGIWNGTIACKFHQMLKRWTRFEWNMQQASYWMRMHGIGPCIFERADDWRFRAIDSASILVERDSPSFIDERLPIVAVRVRYRSHELFQFIRDEKAAADQGWDVEAVRRALRHAYHGGGASTYSQIGGIGWEELQRRLKNDDLFTSFCDSDEIACAHLFVTEYSGKASHFIITENAIPGDDPRDDDAGTEFLYRHVARYDSIMQALVVFFQDIGDGTWHSVRGLAELAFKHLAVLNRLDCRTIDNAFITSGVILRSGTQRDVQQLQAVQWSSMTVLPAGMEVVEMQVSGKLEGAMAVSRTVRNGLSNNIGMFNQRSVARDDGRGEAVTAEQIRAQVSKESTLSQGQMTLYYLALDKLYAEMFRRASDPHAQDEEAKRFQQECLEAGVPDQCLQQMEYVRANRAAGYGSPQMAQMQLNQLMPVVGMLPEDGKNAYLDMVIQATLGAEKVRLLNPQHRVMTQDDDIAALENSVMWMGDPVTLAAGQNDVLHLQSHIEYAHQKLAPVEQAIQGGQHDAAQLETAIAYVAQLETNAEGHLTRMRTDPTRRQLVPLFEKEIKQVVQFSGEMRAAYFKAQRDAQIAAEQQQQATALGELDQAKVQSMQVDNQINMAKAQNRMQNTTATTIHRNRLKEIDLAAKIRRENLLAAHEARNGNGETP